MQYYHHDALLMSLCLSPDCGLRYGDFANSYFSLSCRASCMAQSQPEEVIFLSGKLHLRGFIYKPNGWNK